MRNISPKVSVCLLTYNHARYIRASIESVLAQANDVELEIFIGDDCSDDGTSEIVAAFAIEHPRLITHVRHGTRIGGAANYAAVLAASHAPFIAYLDGDDYWLTGKLKRQLDYLGGHPACTAVYSNALTIGEQGEPIGMFNDVIDVEFKLAGLLRQGNFLNNSSMVHRAASRPALLGIEVPVIDYRVHLLLARTGFVAQLSVPLVAYRIGSVGSVVKHDNSRVRQLYWEAIMSVPRELITDDDLARGIADFLRRVFYRSLRTRRITLIKQWLPRAFAESPYGMTKTSRLAIESIIRIGYKELVGRVRKDAHGRRIKVLYRR
jgi:glycosyltransferase involved in cell wall biosynthesis